jgi:hypothetical protein
MPTYANIPPSEPANYLQKSFPQDVRKNGSWGKKKKFDIVWSVKNGARRLEDVLVEYAMDIAEYNTWLKKYNAEVYNAHAPHHLHPERKLRRCRNTGVR